MSFQKFRFLVTHSITFPIRFFRRTLLFSQILGLNEIEDRFTKIYQSNAWGSKWSRSGSGSTLHATSAIRKSLPLILEQYSIASMLDAPCGDFRWMSTIDFPLGFRYLGGDIVSPLISELKTNYTSSSIDFIHLDITSDDLPQVDLLLTRDCLFHFSTKDIYKFFANFAKSNIPYLLTTSHETGSNYIYKDIITGDFRVLDLTKPPFNLPSQALWKVNEQAEGLLPDKSLFLFTKNQVVAALK